MDTTGLVKQGVRKLGSPVRLFTSIPLSLLELPSREGYRLCGECRVWVAQENTHCDQCGVCTSKDGRTYMHCKLSTHQCGAGVKAGQENAEDKVKKVEVEENAFSGKRKSRKRNRHKRHKIPKKN